MEFKLANAEYIKQEYEWNKVYEYMEKYTQNINFKDEIKEVNSQIKINRTIWVMWLQGEENAPLLVKSCIASIRKNIPDDYEIVVLTNYNIYEYVTVPDYILEKYRKKIISNTQFSDIIRVCLLAMYGGCWIDATVYCMDKIPKAFLNGKMFMFKIPAVTSNPIIKTSSWWIYAQKDSRLMVGLREVLYKYWKDENRTIDYFIFHVIFSRLVDTDKDCKALYNNMIYYSSGNAHYLYGKLSRRFNEEEYEMIKFVSPIQKLSYKRHFLLGDDNYYEKIVKG